MRHFLLALTLGLSGCATVFTGSYQNVVIRTEPKEAKVSINGIYKGTTPLTLALPREADAPLSIEHTGYSPVNLKIERTFNYVTLINAINPIGWAVDYWTGSMWWLTPSMLEVPLSR